MDDFLLSTQKSARKSRGRKGEKKNKDVSQARVKRHKETKIWICFFTRKNTYLEICTKLTTGSQSNCKEHDVETGGLYAPERIDLHALTRRVTNSWMWISEHWRHQATTPHVNNMDSKQQEKRRTRRPCQARSPSLCSSPPRSPQSPSTPHVARASRAPPTFRVYVGRRAARQPCHPRRTLTGQQTVHTRADSYHPLGHLRAGMIWKTNLSDVIDTHDS